MALTVAEHDLEPGPYSDLWLQVWQATSTKALPRTYLAPDSLQPYLRMVHEAAGQPAPLVKLTPEPVGRRAAHNGAPTMVVAFSGGKDSCASALLAQARGYQVLLYHVRGINPAYPKEWQAAQRMAKLLGLPLAVRRLQCKGKQEWMDNPTKNQALLGWMLQYGLTRGALHYTVGDMATDYLATAQVECNLSDSYELLEAAAAHFRVGTPGYTYHHQLRHITDSLAIIGLLRPDLLPQVLGCVAPLRFKEGYRRHNEQRYGVQLLPGRCGSCWKCCVEWVALQRMGLGARPPAADLAAMEQHCIDYLRRVMPREKPHVPDSYRASDEEVLALYLSMDVVNEARTLQGLPTYEVTPAPFANADAPTVASLPSPLLELAQA
jgi:hypothetical protein